MLRSDFIQPENWSGGPTYGLVMAWGRPDDQRMLRAMQALLEVPCLQGPWSSPEGFPGPTDPWSTIDREEGAKRYGLLSLEDGTEVCCLMFPVLGEFAASDGTDWLVLVVMYGTQERAFNLVYFTDHYRRDNPWLDQLDAQFLAIAEAVYEAVPFDFAVIDHEGILPLDDDPSKNFTAQLPHGGLLLPPHMRTLVPDAEDWVVRDSGLHWLPSREA